MATTTTHPTPPFADRAKDVPVSFVREILKAANQKGLISFAGGLPNPDLFPTKELGIAANNVFTKNGQAALQYANTEGYYPLRKYIS